VTHAKLPLGRNTRYPDQYEPDVLFPIPRAESREALALQPLPFHGVDIWNAWELTWLDGGNMPVAATAEMRFPADTPNLIESKSLKLYLNSFAMTSFNSSDTVEETIGRDLAAAAGGPVGVHVKPAANTEADSVARLPGFCLDELSVRCDTWDVDAELLLADPEVPVEEDLYTHLLRSLCPVTAQPDIGSLAVHYRGPKIDPASLLRYVVSFRQHDDFHEACVERMFVDILTRCNPEKLSVFARFQRRGGIDINPFRSNFESHPGNQRLWRQ
jgi:7-cyano-7-deazaguanine reductase